MEREPARRHPPFPRAASRRTLAALDERMGKLLNIHGEMAPAAVLPTAYAGMQDAIAERGAFDARVREAIALSVSAVDRCTYCRSSHTLAAKTARR